ncbi:hypothetical protein HXX76_008237 [Chlamydomonas incerta]|uniref:Uncharacterized protein n=1 Tax=Chlamydomonas incerta TaxID=51695 RepID=A0A835SVB4_CHLIN|nr:hypothetical protein HXX76_008237 [Chlamydomonas incerta]|eukprot:KAG2433884.1 hypothetical protein HXX76_008237 [Chlamydomonas incerta]
MSRHAKTGPGASAGAGSSSEEGLAAVEAKLAQFRQLYSNYRKDESSQLRSLLASQVGASPAAAGAAAAGGRAQAEAVPAKSALKGSKTQAHRPSSAGKQRPQSPAAKAAAAHVRAATGSPGRKALPVSNGHGLDVGPDQLTTVQKLLMELDVKDMTLSNLQSQLSSIQAQLHQQEAREDEARADSQRQVNQLQEKLGTASEKLHRLEAERWEVLEAVSTVAAGSSALDREQREVERTRLALADKEREVAAREAVAAANIQASIAPERLGLEDLSLLATHYAELNGALDRADAAVRRRVLLLAGHNPLADGNEDGEGGLDNSSALVVAGRRLAAAVDMSHEPCLGYLQVVREGLIAANSYVGAHAGSERHSSAVLVAPIVRHLQQQAAGLSRALVLLASEAEADAARLALVEAQGRERDGQLADALADVRRLTAEAALAAQAAGLAQQLREQRQENEALQSRLRSMRKKLKVAFEEVTAQNRELRDKLSAAQAAREDDGSRMSSQVQQLQDEVTAARKQLQVHQRREAKLAAELVEARQLAAAAVERGEGLQRDLEAALDRAGRAEARVVDLEAESRGQRALALRVAKEHEAQLVELRAEVQEQLETVVQSYSEELSALQQQLERVEAQQAATAAGLRGPGAGAGTGNTSSAAAASAGRAEAWRMAYEEVREVAHTLKDQLDAAEEENSRLQAQLQRLTTVAVATAAATEGITPRAKVAAAAAATPAAVARSPAAAPALALPAPPAAADPTPSQQTVGSGACVTVAPLPATAPSMLTQVQPAHTADAATAPARSRAASGASSDGAATFAAQVAAAQAAAIAAATAVVARRTDAGSETERLLTRQKSAQTDAPPQEPRMATQPASPPPVAAPQPIPTSQLVIVVRQEPAPRSSHHHHHHRASRGRSRSRSPSRASSGGTSGSSPPQPPRSRGRAATATAATATIDTPSRSVGVGDANVRAPQTEDVAVEAAIRSGAGSVSTPSEQRSGGDAYARGHPAPQYYNGEGAAEDEGEDELEGEEELEEDEEGGMVTDVDLDKKGLALHVAALQEQLAALTHQNSIITSQVIEMRQEQDRLSSRRSSPARTGGYGSVTGPYGTPSYARDMAQQQPDRDALGGQEVEQQHHARPQRPQPQAASGRSSLPRMASPASAAAQSQTGLTAPQQGVDAHAPTPSGPAQSAASARSAPPPRPPAPGPGQQQQRHQQPPQQQHPEGDWHEAAAAYGEEYLEDDEEREEEVRAVEQLPDPSHASISLGLAGAGASAGAASTSTGTSAAAAQVRAELAALRAQYAELHSRYQRQSVRQQELQDALLNVASGKLQAAGSRSGIGLQAATLGARPGGAASVASSAAAQATTHDRSRRMSWKDAADMMVDGSGKRGWREETSEEQGFEELEQQLQRRPAAWQDAVVWQGDAAEELELQPAAAGYPEREEQESGSGEEGALGGDAGVEGDEEQEDGEHGDHAHQQRHATQRPRKYLRARHHHHVHHHALALQQHQHMHMRQQQLHQLHQLHQHASAPAAVPAPQRQQRPTPGLELTPARPHQATAAQKQPQDQLAPQSTQLPPQQVWPFTGSRVSSSGSAGAALHAARPGTSTGSRAVAAAAPAAQQAPQLQHQQRPSQAEPASRPLHHYGRADTGAPAAAQLVQQTPQPHALSPQHPLRQPLPPPPPAQLQPQPVSPTTSLSQQPLLPQRSGDLYISTTPFFPLGPETSDFLDRAASIDVGIRHDPDLATTAADAGRVYGDGDESGPGSPHGSSGTGQGGHQQQHHQHQTHHRTPSYDDEEDEVDYDDMDVGGVGGGTGSGMEPDDGEDNGIHDDLDPEDPGQATLGSASTFTFVDYDPEELAGEEDEVDDDPVGSNAGHSGSVSSSSSTGTGVGTGSGETAAPQGAAPAGPSGLRSPQHTTASFRPESQHGEAGVAGHATAPGHHRRARTSGSSSGASSAGDADAPRHALAPAAAAVAAPSSAPPAGQPHEGAPVSAQPQRAVGRAAAAAAAAADVAAAATPDGPLVPPEVLARMAEYAGDEGLARPSTAVPSALRHSEPGVGPPVPPEVLSYMQQYTGGGEGDVRPPTASPSVLRAGAGSREVPVPPEVLSYMQQYTGDEGHARPSTAAPSVLAANRSMPELPVPEPVLHTAMLFQTGGEGISRPTTAPSSDERRARLTAVASAPQLAPLQAALGSGAAGSSPDHRPPHGAATAAATSSLGGGSSGGGASSSGGGAGGISLSPTSGVVLSVTSPRPPLPAAPRPPLQAPPTLAFQPQYLQQQPHLQLPQQLQQVDMQPPGDAADRVIRHFRHSSGSVGQGELLYEGEGLMRQDTGGSGRGAAAVSVAAAPSSSEAGRGSAAGVAGHDSGSEQWPAEAPGSSVAASDDDDEQGHAYGHSGHVARPGYGRRQAAPAAAAASSADAAFWREAAGVQRHHEGADSDLGRGHAGPPEHHHQQTGEEEDEEEGEHPHLHVDYEAEEGGYEAEGPAAEPHLLHDPQDVHDQQYWQQLLEEDGFGEQPGLAHVGADEGGHGYGGEDSDDMWDEDEDGGRGELEVRGLGSQEEEEDEEEADEAETGSSSMGASRAMPSFSSAATFSDLPLAPQPPLPGAVAVAAPRPWLQQPEQQLLPLQPQLPHMEEEDDEDGGVDDESGAFRVVVGSWLSGPATSAVPAVAPPAAAPAPLHGWPRGSLGPSPLGPAAAASASGQHQARPTTAAANAGARGRSRQPAPAGGQAGDSQPAAVAAQVQARRRSLGQELALEEPYDPGSVDLDPRSAVWLLGAGLGVPHGEEGSDWERSSAASWA